MTFSVRILTSKQAENISELIISIGADAEIRGEIVEKEKEAILDFIGQAMAGIKHIDLGESTMSI